MTSNRRQQAEQAGDRPRAGTGLGSAIRRDFLEAMGGTIVAGNRKGRSAEFTVTLAAASHPPLEDSTP